MTEKEATLAVGDDSGSPEVQFHYIKSNHFRVIHADGAFGGVTARGYVQVAFYSERRAIPRVIGLVRDAETGSLEEKVIDTREGWVREVEVDVLLDERTTEELVEWLQDKLNLLRTLHAREQRDPAET